MNNKIELLSIVTAAGIKDLTYRLGDQVLLVTKSAHGTSYALNPGPKVELITEAELRVLRAIEAAKARKR